MVFKRYSNPLFFVNNLIKNHCFADGIKDLFDDIEEQRLWELYCHSINSRMISGDARSFEEWRKNDSKQEESKSMTENEILTAEKKSKEILKRISPKKQGG